MELTHRRLLEILEYIPETGIFYWKDDNLHNTRRGFVAGHTSKIHGYN